jgi:hypothetical protein
MKMKTHNNRLTPNDRDSSSKLSRHGSKEEKNEPEIGILGILTDQCFLGGGLKSTSTNYGRPL